MYHQNGYLEIILGTMFSGKTSYLLHKISIMTELELKVLYINIDFDNRSTDSYSTHNPFLENMDSKNKEKLSKFIKMIKVRNLYDIPQDLLESSDVIMIDEAQFFEGLAIFVNNLLEKNKNIFVGSLIADFKGTKFGEALDLIPVCDNIVKLNSYCMECKKDKEYKHAVFSKKITVTEDLSNIDIGGSDKYIAVCRYHNKV